MKKILTLAMLLIAATGFCGVIQSNDFTPAENDTLPTNIVSEWSPNAAVKPLNDATLGIPADHAAPNDGYCLRLYDQGGYNFAYPADYATVSKTDSTVEAWVYVNLDSATSERDLGLGIRVGIDPVPDIGGRAIYNEMRGYWFFVTANSSWSGISPNPTNKRAIILKKVSGTFSMVGTEGTSDIVDGWHKFKLVAEGTTISAYVDDVLQVQGTDTTYTTGFAAMVYYGGATDAGGFDNFVWSEPDTTVQDWEMY